MVEITYERTNFFIQSINGIYCYVQRKIAPEKIEKLQSMIERNGEKMGNSIHLFGYTILPIVAGLLLLLAHFRA